MFAQCSYSTLTGPTLLLLSCLVWTAVSQFLIMVPAFIWALRFMYCCSVGVSKYSSWSIEAGLGLHHHRFREAWRIHVLAMALMLVLVILWLETTTLWFVLRQSRFRTIYGLAWSCLLLRRATTLGHARTICDHTTHGGPHDLWSLVRLQLLATHSFCLFI